MTLENALPGAQDKINEYVERIKGGESKDSIMQGLPKSFTDAIEERLASKEKLESEDKEKIEEIRKEISPSEEKDNFKKKEVEHDFGDHAQAVSIFNGMMEIGKGLTEGLKEDFARKIEQYANEIKSGKSREYVLGNLPEKWKKAVEDKLAEDGGFEKVDDLENIISNIQSKIRDDFENLNIDEIKEQIKLRHDLVAWKNRGRLSDELFSAGKGNTYEDENGNFFAWESVNGEIGKNFDAHGLSKLDQLSSLLSLLDNGIDKSRDFYTAPFELPESDKAGAGAAIGTGDGTAYKDGIAVVVSGFKENLKESGIKHVFVNDVFKEIKEALSKAYPQYNFHLLSEQKQVLESEARSAV